MRNKKNKEVKERLDPLLSNLDIPTNKLHESFKELCLTVAKQQGVVPKEYSSFKCEYNDFLSFCINKMILRREKDIKRKNRESKKIIKSWYYYVSRNMLHWLKEYNLNVVDLNQLASFLLPSSSTKIEEVTFNEKKLLIKTFHLLSTITPSFPLSSLPLVLERKDIIKFLNAFGGKTITVPTLEEFEIVVKCCIIYELGGYNKAKFYCKDIVEEISEEMYIAISSRFKD